MKTQDIHTIHDIPSRSVVRSVYLVAFDAAGNVIITENERGWDVIGGHVESDDASLMHALQREAEEEGSLVFESAQPFLILQADGVDDVMLFFVSSSCTLNNFITHHDVLGRDVVSVEEFLNRYHGDRSLMKEIIEKAQKQ